MLQNGEVLSWPGNMLAWPCPRLNHVLVRKYVSRPNNQDLLSSSSVMKHSLSYEDPNYIIRYRLTTNSPRWDDQLIVSDMLWYFWLFSYHLKYDNRGDTNPEETEVYNGIIGNYVNIPPIHVRLGDGVLFEVCYFEKKLPPHVPPYLCVWISLL